MANRVLLIEDEPNIIEAIRFILNRDGWTVDVHSDGATAVDRISEKAPDVIILDVMLPNRSGFEIMQDLRSRPASSETPVLMLTARGQDKDRARAMALGVTRFMAKPFANADVLQAVREMAGK